MNNVSEKTLEAGFLPGPGDGKTTPRPLGKAIYIMLALVLIVSATAAALGVVSILGIKNVNSELRDMDGEIIKVGEFIEYATGIIGATQDVAQEDDVTIGGRYVIKSTRAISDAYITKDTSALDDKQKETLSMASAILDSIIKDGMSKYEMALAVYDWMCANLKSDEGVIVAIPTTTEDCDNPYGVLKYHNAVCVGYATTYRLFMQMLGIECMVVHDSWLSHTWDLVKLDDGKWYHTDIYMDVGEGNYKNFCMNDTLAAMGHTWNKDFFPAANGMEYCYVYKNAVPVTDIFELPTLIKKGSEDDVTALYYSFSSLDARTYQMIETMMSLISSYFGSYYRYDYDGAQIYADIYGIGEMSDLIVDRPVPKSLYWDWIGGPNGEYIMRISITKQENSNYYELTEEEYRQIQEAVTDVFDDNQNSNVISAEICYISRDNAGPYYIVMSGGCFYIVYTEPLGGAYVGSIISIDITNADYIYLGGVEREFPDYGFLPIEAEIYGANVWLEGSPIRG